MRPGAGPLEPFQAAVPPATVHLIGHKEDLVHVTLLVQPCECEVGGRLRIDGLPEVWHPRSTVVGRRPHGRDRGRQQALVSACSPRMGLPALLGGPPAGSPMDSLP